jgi:hypothetical protein
VASRVVFSSIELVIVIVIVIIIIIIIIHEKFILFSPGVTSPGLGSSSACNASYGNLSHVHPC